MVAEGNVESFIQKQEREMILKDQQIYDIVELKMIKKLCKYNMVIDSITTGAIIAVLDDQWYNWDTLSPGMQSAAFVILIFDLVTVFLDFLISWA